jgi:hypothetical protein
MIRRWLTRALSEHNYFPCRRLRKRTPGPPPFSSMNSTPARSKACLTTTIVARRDSICRASIWRTVKASKKKNYRQGFSPELSGIGFAVFLGATKPSCGRSGAFGEPLRVPRLRDVANRDCGAIPSHAIFIDIHTEARPPEDIHMAVANRYWRS